MPQRFFNLSDLPTVHNLQVLDHLSRQRCRSGDFHEIDTLLLAAIGAINVLPAAVRRHIRSAGFFTAGRHDRMKPQARIALWDRLSVDLSSDLDQVLTDTSLAPGGGADLSDRNQTRGERIEKLCDQLAIASQGGGSALALAHELAREGSGTDAGSDGKELVRLLSRKTISDWEKHRFEIVRRITHAHDVAQHLHHLP